MVRVRPESLNHLRLEYFQMELAKLDALGRVVIPARLRKALGLRAGARLRVERTREGVLLTPLRDNAVLRMAKEHPLRLGRRAALALTVERMDEIAEKSFETES